MSLLADLYKNRIDIREDNSLDELPEDVMSEIQKNIRKGAKDVDQDWSNALHLVQKAYEVAGVQRPTPDMQSAWKQYETNIQYAVQQLSKARGMDGDWRMSAAIFHEAMIKTHKFRVTEMGSSDSKTHVVEATSINEIIDAIKENSDLDVKVDHSKDPENPNSVTISFSKWNVRKNYRIKIQQL